VNRGWIYRDTVAAADAGRRISDWYSERHRHSSLATWQQRLQQGEILVNGEQPGGDICLSGGDQLAWHRPPWQEEAVPLHWQVIFDNGDLLVINKPSGLPVLPAGGFLEHTLLHQLAQKHQRDPQGLPRPVHRLGRHTSGLLVCARRPASRAWLSRILRDSSRSDAERKSGSGCRKFYRALSQPLASDWSIGEARAITTAIGKKPHPLLGEIWCALQPGETGGLASCSMLKLLERRPGSCLLEVEISTGRPHQIRIHCAAIGAPLLGDPLYVAGGTALARALPGDAGYKLHAYSFWLADSNHGNWQWLAPLPPALAPFKSQQA
jgi:23S rRNA pseudouridine1911/1915/1917 synthase